MQRPPISRQSGPRLGTTARLAWIVLAYVALVILYGSVVRVTGSGAGCGRHWPTCQGDVAYIPDNLQAAIELTHRVTSGLSLLAVGWLYYRVRRTCARGDATRLTAALAVGFVLAESLIGAGLVLFRLVADDTSLARAVVVPLHLANASLLIASLALTAWGSTWDLPPRTRWAADPDSRRMLWLLSLLLLVAMSGAVTALGDTLFPPRTEHHLIKGLVWDQSARAHLLQRIRLAHPVLALLAGFVILKFAIGLALDQISSNSVRRLARNLAIVTVAQMLLGLIDIAWSAPATIQIVHLAFALLVWVTAVFLWAATAQPRSG